ncbi:MAG: EF-hand domain-containing protein [Syntrophales bacterium]|nr:EF-hand domain-containing protein [Syntrophales bacterium]MDD5642341.1 EF-hand domain-containing protein [Syntrophales bacterium]
MPQSLKVLVFLAAALIFLASGFAPAGARTPTREQVKKSWEKRFHDLDKNGDGKVTLTEYLAYFRAYSGPRRQYFEFEFRKYDRNGDGVITHAEHWAPVTLKDEFRALDKNRDGCISRSEWLQGIKQFFKLDRNRDGCLTLEEYLNGYRNRSPRR